MVAGVPGKNESESVSNLTDLPGQETEFKNVTGQPYPDDLSRILEQTAANR